MKSIAKCSLALRQGAISERGSGPLANPLHYPLQHPLTGSIAFRGSDEAARSRLHAGRWTTSRASFGSLDRRHRVDESGLETIDADAVLSNSVV